MLPASLSFEAQNLENRMTPRKKVSITEHRL